MSCVLVTGSGGFIGRRVADRLKSEGHEVFTYDVEDPPKALADHVAKADFIFHFAGVNRPTDVGEFERVNVNLTEQLCALAGRAEANPVVVLASSTQALLDNPYGVSKRQAEQVLERLAKAGGRVVIFRLPNVFGPGCRPNYNSVVATFAYNAAQGIPLQVNDPVRELTLVYVHDVAQAMLTLMRAPPSKGQVEYREASPVTRATLQELATTFAAFRQSRLDATAPTVATAFERKLYATYLSHLNPDALAYNLTAKSDTRGVLAEFLKSEASGQLFISRTRPGAVRGNHYHRTKTEKFFVVEGEGLIRIRRVDEKGECIHYRVSGTDLRVVDIPPDHTHSIENVGSGELVVLFWASEIFDPNAADTVPLKV